MNKPIVCFAPAKINLALHIVGQKQDGYHLLESLVCFANFGDTISYMPKKEQRNFTLKIDGPFADTLTVDDNLVLKAAHLFADQNKGALGGEITLTKNLPIASGLGGGSADAAATLNAMAQFAGNINTEQLLEIAVELGADVPMCLHTQPLIARGIGEKISFIETFPELHMLLVNPNIAVSTPKIFKYLTNKKNTPLATLPKNNEWFDWINTQRNDLEPPAVKAEPVIGDVLLAIEKSGAQISRMSGSGATCFGIYSSHEACQQAQNQISKRYPKWWCVASKTNSSLIRK